MKKLFTIFATFAMLCAVGCEVQNNDSVNPNEKPDTSAEGNKIYYTTSDGKKLFPYNTEPATFGAILVSNTYEEGQGVLTFDDTITSIGKEAFRDCRSLTSVSIPDGVTEIGKDAFYGCSSLASITIPASVTEIGGEAFRDCSSLTSVHITDIAAWCGISFSDNAANPLYYAHNLYLNGELVTDLVIPDGVTSIGDYAFRDCSSLTSITIPDSVTEIGDYAFSKCTSLTSVTIGNGVNSIGRSAFSNCSSLTSVTIPDGVTEIGYYTFYNCTSLTSITIPDSVTSIGSHAFRGCSSLTSVTIPDSVTQIGQSAFYECSSLTSITIPDSVTSIGWCSFSDCTSLTSVYCKPTTPPSIDLLYVFEGNASGLKIYVPTESVEAYKTAWGWDYYADAIVGYDF